MRSSGCAFAAQGPSKGSTDPLLCAADSDLGTRGTCVSSSIIQGAHPCVPLPGGVGLEGTAGLHSGTPIRCPWASGPPGREGQTPCPGRPWLWGMQAFVSFCLGLKHCANFQAVSP